MYIIHVYHNVVRGDLWPEIRWARGFRARNALHCWDRRRVINTPERLSPYRFTKIWPAIKAVRYSVYGEPFLKIRLTCKRKMIAFEITPSPPHSLPSWSLRQAGFSTRIQFGRHPVSDRHNAITFRSITSKFRTGSKNVEHGVQCDELWSFHDVYVTRDS